MSLVTRFVQPPPTAGYGFGASVIVAGLVLTPFSLAGLVTNRVAPATARRTSLEAVLAISLSHARQHDSRSGDWPLLSAAPQAA